MGLDVLALQALEAELVDGLTKGLPHDLAPTPIGEIGRQGWNVADGDLPLPLLTLKQSALRHNLAFMSQYCERRGVRLAPHGKTTMAPQLHNSQLDAGAWAITVATVGQLRVLREFGAGRVLLANQPVGDAAIDYLCRELRADPEFELYLLVDSLALVETLADAARAHELSNPIRVFLEAGYLGGRTGTRSDRELLTIARACVDHADVVRAVGVAGWEGLITPDSAASIRSSMTIESYYARLRDATDLLLNAELLPRPFLITVGVSTSFELAVETFAGAWPDLEALVLRCGQYITHDSAPYNTTPPMIRPEQAFRPALELWGGVQSRPEPDLALLNFGRRDVSFDRGLPVPAFRVPRGSSTRQPLRNAHLVELNDHHAFLRVLPEQALEFGDRIVSGIQHPCTAFEKWRVILVTDDADRVVDAIRTYF